MKKRLYTFLKWTEQYTKTDMVYLAQGSFLLSITKGVGIITSLITSVAFANLLPEDVYGTYRYVLSIMTLLVIPTLTGIDTALTRAIAKGESHTLVPALVTKMRWGLLGSLGSLGLAGYYYIAGDTTLCLSFLLASLFVPVMDPVNIFNSYLSGKKDFKRQTYYQLIIRSLSAAAIIGGVFMSTNVLVLLGIYFASYTVLRLFFFLVVMRELPAQQQSAPHTTSLGFHLTIQSIPTTFTKTIDSILIFQFIGGAALAGYALARLPLKQGQNVIGSINILALPNLSKRTWEEIRKSLPHKIVKTYLIIVPIILGYWLFAEDFFSLLYPQYMEYVFISKLFSLQLLSLPISLIDTALTALGEKRKLYVYAISTSALRLLLLLVLIPTFGVLGATYAFLSTAFFGSLVLIMLFFTHKPDTPN